MSVEIPAANLRMTFTKSFAGGDRDLAPANENRSPAIGFITWPAKILIKGGGDIKGCMLNTRVGHSPSVSYSLLELQNVLSCFGQVISYI